MVLAAVVVVVVVVVAAAAAAVVVVGIVAAEMIVSLYMHDFNFFLLQLPFSKKKRCKFFYIILQTFRILFQVLLPMPLIEIVSAPRHTLYLKHISSVIIIQYGIDEEPNKLSCDLFITKVSAIKES